MPFVLYRLRDVDGQLLWIGITKNLTDRLASHRARSYFWPLVHDHAVETFEKWPDAVKAENLAIRREKPLHNANVGVWRHIKHDIEDAVTSGAWPPGTLVPSTAELAEMYGCGRSTVRSAVQLLRDIGVLYGRQGVGVFVAPAPD